MKIQTTPIYILMSLSILMTGCTASFSTNSSSPANAKPANTTSSPATNSAANSNANTAKKADETSPSAKLANEKKPEGKAKTASSKTAVPTNWIYVYDEAKGYGFSVPEGSTGGSETQEGVDTFIAQTPAPNEVAVVVISFKDKKMTKEDLLDVAVNFLEGMDKKVQPGKLTGESEEYSLAEATTTNNDDGSKQKCKILVGTDVTDNYVMIVGTEEAKFTANEKIIDEIWGSFEMWSRM